MKQVNIALVGLGTVGSGVYRTIAMQKNNIAHKEGIALNLKKVLALAYAIDIPDVLKAKDFYADIIEDESIDIVIELIGGVNPAKAFILAALDAGKTVVTANKELLARHWPELNAAAKRSGAGLYFEASVGGGIPVLRTIWDSLQANDITSVMGHHQRHDQLYLNKDGGGRRKLCGCAQGSAAAWHGRSESGKRRGRASTQCTSFPSFHQWRSMRASPSNISIVKGLRKSPRRISAMATSSDIR